MIQIISFDEIPDELKFHLSFQYSAISSLPDLINDSGSFIAIDYDWIGSYDGYAILKAFEIEYVYFIRPSLLTPSNEGSVIKLDLIDNYDYLTLVMDGISSENIDPIGSYLKFGVFLTLAKGRVYKIALSTDFERAIFFDLSEEDRKFVFNNLVLLNIKQMEIFDNGNFITH